MLDYKLAEKFIKLKQNTKNELGNGTEMIHDSSSDEHETS